MFSLRIILVLVERLKELVPIFQSKPTGGENLRHFGDGFVRDPHLVVNVFECFDELGSVCNEIRG